MTHLRAQIMGCYKNENENKKKTFYIKEHLHAFDTTSIYLKLKKNISEILLCNGFKQNGHYSNKFKQNNTFILI